MTEKKKRHLHLVSDDTEYKDYALSALDDVLVVVLRTSSYFLHVVLPSTI